MHRCLATIVCASAMQCALPAPRSCTSGAVAAPLPEASARAGGVFKLELFLPEDYPMAAPKARRAFALPPSSSEAAATHAAEWW